MNDKRDRPESLDKQEKQLEENSKSKSNSKFKNTMGSLKVMKGVTNIEKYDNTKEKELPRQYFRQEVVELSKSLLGKVLVRKTKQATIRAVIVETQAYKAPLDKGCHAYNSTILLKQDKKTEKTKYFWLDGGFLYIYTIYMPTNICLNVVAGLQGQPEAVLIRAVQPVQGIDLVKKLRNIKSKKFEDVSNGPGKVGQSLAINKETMNGMDLIGGGDFTIVDAGINDFKMGVSRRVNIDYAEEWTDKPWRFYIEGNTFVSKVKFND